MVCPYCSKGAGNPGESCPVCAKALPRYGAPEGFAPDPGRGLYRRREGGATLWFDPVAGTYTREDDPRQAEDWIPAAPAQPLPQGFVLEPSSGLYRREDAAGVTWYDPLTGQYETQGGTPAQAAPVPAPPPASPPPATAAPSRYALPPGFVADEGSGLAWAAQPPVVERGERVIATTWFDPATGEYAQVNYRASAEPAPTGEHAQVSYRASAEPAPMGAMPGAGAPPVMPPKKRSPLPLAAALAVVLVGGGLFWALRWGPLADKGEALSPAPAGEESAQSGGELPSVASPAQSEPATPAPGSSVIVWQDAAMEEAIRSWLNKPQGDIAAPELDGVYEILFMEDRIILFLEGNEQHYYETPARELGDLIHFQNLRGVAFDPDPVYSDLSVLTQLPGLERLIFGKAGRFVLDRLPPLPELKSLWLMDCALVDLAGIEKFPALEELMLQDNPGLRDVMPLTQLPHLRYLDLTGTAAEDLDALAHVEQVIGGAEREASPGAVAESMRPFADAGLTMDEYFAWEFDRAREMSAAAGYNTDPLVERGLGWFEVLEPVDGARLGFDLTRIASGDPGWPVALRLPVSAVFGQDTVSLREIEERFGRPNMGQIQATDFFPGGFQLYHSTGRYVTCFDAKAEEDAAIEYMTIVLAEYFYEKLS